MTSPLHPPSNAANPDCSEVTLTRQRFQRISRVNRSANAASVFRFGFEPFRIEIRNGSQGFKLRHYLATAYVDRPLVESVTSLYSSLASSTRRDHDENWDRDGIDFHADGIRGRPAERAGHSEFPARQHRDLHRRPADNGATDGAQG